MTPKDWTQYGTGLLSDCLGRFGAMDGGIGRLVGRSFAGPAVTVEVASGENATIHRAVASISEGSALIVAAAGSLERAVWGEVLATAAVERGVVGVVIDGAVRDLDRLLEIGLPTYARGRCPLGPHKGWPGRSNVPVACGGVVVAPGDVVVGDGDGVVCIPGGMTDQVWELAAARQRQEATWLERVRHGESTVEMLGLEEAK